MADYFLDSSALVKRHVLEVGSTWMRSLVRARAAQPTRMTVAQRAGRALDGPFWASYNHLGEGVGEETGDRVISFESSKAMDESRREKTRLVDPGGGIAGPASANRLDKAAILSALEDLKTLRHGWDGRHAGPIDVEVIQKAKDFILALPHDLATTPRVVPMTRGRLQFEWHEGTGPWNWNSRTPAGSTFSNGIRTPAWRRKTSSPWVTTCASAA